MMSKEGIPGLYGLWSLARKDWMFDPMLDDCTPLQFENIMDAIAKAATYHFAFHVVPIRFNQHGRPCKIDLDNMVAD